MINFDFERACTGCAACSDVCAHCCITIENKHGFRIPRVDSSTCVNCGLCDKVCPVLNVNIRVNSNQKCYCSYYLDENVRYMGSSGSMFYLIAEWTISQGGVVFGAAFDNQLKLRHMVATTITELRPLMKSKYLQSDTTGVFKSVHEYLRNGQMVLFVGTPCQCNALYNFIPESRKDNLLMVDFICHGVPSQQLFDRYISWYENKHNVKVTQFSFRHKPLSSSGDEEDVHHYRISFVDKNGKTGEETGYYDKCSFYAGFKKYQIFRNSCYECKFVGKNRITDFTLGDFWHLTEFEPEIKDFYKGYSELIVNSEKGLKLFENLKSKIYYKEYSMDIPMKRNHAYSRPTVRHFDRDIFSNFYFLPYSVLSLIWNRNIIIRGSVFILRKILG